MKTKTKNNIALLQDKIEHYFSFLKEKYGYTIIPELEIHESEILQFWREYSYLNSAIKRKIIINHFPFNKEKKEEDSIAISITKYPYNGIKDYIDLELLILKKNPEFDKKQLEFNYYQGSFLKQTDYLLSAFSKLLEEYASDIIIGESWEEGCYPEW